MKPKPKSNNNNNNSIITNLSMNNNNQWISSETITSEDEQEAKSLYDGNENEENDSLMKTITITDKMNDKLFNEFDLSKFQNNNNETYVEEMKQSQTQSYIHSNSNDNMSNLLNTPNKLLNLISKFDRTKMNIRNNKLQHQKYQLQQQTQLQQSQNDEKISYLRGL